jgi:hypothetical protein
MAVFTTKVFGDLVVEVADAGYCERETVVGSRVLKRSLFVGADLATDEDLLSLGASLVDTLDTLDARAREAIRVENEGGDGTVRGYAEFHLEELDADVLMQIFGHETPERSAIDRGTFLAKLDLIGISVHARAPSGFSLVLDYSLGRSHTDQVLAVTFDMEGRVLAVNHES